MPEIDDTRMIKRARESLHHAFRWCAYAWVCMGIGFMIMRLDAFIARPIGAAFLLGGIIFCFVAAALSILGMVVPGHASRKSFLLPLIVAAVPIVVFATRVYMVK